MIELDPNQTLAGLVAVVVAVIGLYGVMLSQGRRLKVVKEQVAGANGDTLGADVYATRRQLDLLAHDSNERWQATLDMQATLHRVHSNQVQAIGAATDVLERLAALQQQHVQLDRRIDQVQNHSTRELSELRAVVRELSARVDRLNPIQAHLTPPHGIPAAPAAVTDITD